MTTTFSELQRLLARVLEIPREEITPDTAIRRLPNADSMAMLVEMAVRTKLLLDSVDAYVLSMPSPVNKRARCLFPVVKERAAHAGAGDLRPRARHPRHR